ncbi:hypothetical protein BX616_006912 [Lobosporangium transversale]|uniref:Uncharacterized protein n=1 Tax=Lobosporangium transversale TaxID=64571 RepID=A0A1Y2GGT3_9FUNG|nr:hypothetical protein BCR41DRAFT_360543 [Lobosporangium transversale]KAF9918666.1 hypothetical protein BX616_006912 [Lobosporangium transversale]ORZ07055.1 hypothetical protein BCR41DRAFT_360543 [Lobosporangium transversale]|eukprot:XP_021877851.1 hypothetical protein BCR41DRAFT_360543 [Lobosporangium transversale]
MDLHNEKGNQEIGIAATNASVSTEFNSDGSMIQEAQDISNNVEITTTSNHAGVVEITHTPPVGGHNQWQLPLLPPTSSLTTLPTMTQSQDQEGNPSSPTQPKEDLQPLTPKPLAVKPAYKKRIVVPASRADGIIRRSGALAATEKQMNNRNALGRRDKSVKSIYDKSCSRAPSSRNRITMLKTTKKDTSLKPKRSPIMWKPTSPSGRRLKTYGLAQATIREEDIEMLIKNQEMHTQRIAQLAMRPLPVRDLQTLLQTELEQEAKTLEALGTALHKEILKLQLEEGVLVNMLELTKTGILDDADLELLQPRRRELHSYPGIASNRRASVYTNTSSHQFSLSNTQISDIGSGSSSNANTVGNDNDKPAVMVDKEHSSANIVEDEDLYELEYDQDEVAMNSDMEEDRELEDDDIYYDSEEEEDDWSQYGDDGGADEEDDQVAREALQSMLSKYGADPLGTSECHYSN